MYRKQDKFVILAIIVGNYAFAANESGLPNQFEDKILMNSDVKLYGELKAFIKRSIQRSPKDL